LETHTIVAALRPDAITAPAVFDGPIDNAGFRAYVEQVLVPTLRLGAFVRELTWKSARLGQNDF
jgi:hypothetical protein